MKLFDLLDHVRPRAYKSGTFFWGYRRGRGCPGVRNEIWIIPTSDDARDAASRIVRDYHKPYWIDAARVISLRFDEHAGDEAVRMMVGLARSPNAAGVMFIGHTYGDPPVWKIMNELGSEWARRRACGIKPGGAEEEHALERLDEFAANTPRVREKFCLEELSIGVCLPRRDGAEDVVRAIAKREASPMFAPLGTLPDLSFAMSGVQLSLTDDQTSESIMPSIDASSMNADDMICRALDVASGEKVCGEGRDIDLHVSMMC